MEDNTGMMEFYFQYDEQHPAISIRLSPDSSLPVVLETFEAFLKAAGYNFPGQVSIIETEVIPQDPSADLWKLGDKMKVLVFDLETAPNFELPLEFSSIRTSAWVR